MSRDTKRRRRPDYHGKFVWVHLCCNDHANGQFAGRVEAMEIERRGDSVEIEHIAGSVPRLTLLDGRFRLFRHVFDFDRSKDWVGNWSWNAYRVRIPAAAIILHLAIKGGRFTTTSASGSPAIALDNALAEEVPPSLIEGLLATFGDSTE